MPNNPPEKAASVAAKVTAIAPEQARELVAFCDRVAWLLDDCLHVPGTRFRFGLDAVVGLFPIAGDLLGFAVSGLTLTRAARAGVPKPLLVKMGRNVVIDFFGSLVPVLGDAFDAVFKAHRRNFELLHKEYAAVLPEYRARRRAHWAVRVTAALIVTGLGYGLWHALRH